jgi:AAA-like domain/CHAT domain
MVRKVLILAANPIGSERLQGYAEVREILDSRQESNYRDDFDVKIIPAARPQDFQKALLMHRPEIVHFVGHGIENEGLMLETDDGKSQLVSSDRLREWFTVTNSVKCVILNACYSEVQATAIAKVVPCVIGTLYSFCDRAALEFSIAFYGALFARETYRNAFSMGKSGITNPLEANNLIPMIRDEVENLSAIELEQPGSRMAVESKFYVMRSPAEEDTLREVMKPGALIRITAPHGFGKSSLMGRVVDHAEKQGAKTVEIDCQEIDINCLGSLKDFLKLFCLQVTRKLKVPNRLADYWESGCGSKVDCGEYFEDYLLPLMPNALVLALDEIDWLIDENRMREEDIVDFLSMLRSWHEKGKDNKKWKRLRLILIHSQYIAPKRFPNSPFNNVGIEFRLVELNVAQVIDLTQRHGLNQEIGQKIYGLVGGHPHLVRMGLDTIARRRMTMDELLENGITQAGLYGEHLLSHRSRLQKDPVLMSSFQQVLVSEKGSDIDTEHSKILQSWGLVKPHRNNVQVTCELYRQYFRNVWL